MDGPSVARGAVDHAPELHPSPRGIFSEPDGRANGLRCLGLPWRADGRCGSLSPDEARGASRAQARGEGKITQSQASWAARADGRTVRVRRCSSCGRTALPGHPNDRAWGGRRSQRSAGLAKLVYGSSSVTYAPSLRDAIEMTAREARPIYAPQCASPAPQRSRPIFDKYNKALMSRAGVHDLLLPNALNGDELDIQSMVLPSITSGDIACPSHPRRRSTREPNRTSRKSMVVRRRSHDSVRAPDGLSGYKRRSEKAAE